MLGRPKRHFPSPAAKPREATKPALVALSECVSACCWRLASAQCKMLFAVQHMPVTSMSAVALYQDISLLGYVQESSQPVGSATLES